MSAEPTWNDGGPDRTNDRGVTRSLLHRAVIAAFKRATRGRSYEFLRVVSINKRLFRPFLGYNSRLMPFGTLDRKDTEAVILRTAVLCGSKYEWTQHRAIARSVGVTDRQIELITSDPESADLPERTRLLLRATAELLDRRVLSDVSWDQLRARYAPAQILELVMLIGNYAMLAGALNTFGAPLEPAWHD